MNRTKIIVKKFGKMEKTASGRSRPGQKNGQAGRVSDMVQKVFGICEAKNGTETDDLLQTGTDGHQRIWQDVEENSNTRGRKSPSQGGKKIGGSKGKRKESREGSIEAREHV